MAVNRVFERTFANRITYKPLMGPKKERIMIFIRKTFSAFLCASLTIFCVTNGLACEPSGMGGAPLDKKLQDAVNKFDRRVIRDLQQAIHSPKHQLAEMFGGKSNLATVSNPDKVTGYLLPLDSETDSTKKLHDRKRPFSLTAADQKELSKLLTTHGNYEWGARYLCGIRYGVRIEFQKGNDVVPVYLCLGCGHAGVMLGKKESEHDIRSENLDKQTVFAAVTEIVKRALPDEEAIQKIKIHKQENPYNDTPYDVHLKNLRKDLRKS
jgi:hypothetical protein